jgi:hypothetical protein
MIGRSGKLEGVSEDPMGPSKIEEFIHSLSMKVGRGFILLANYMTSVEFFYFTGHSIRDFE